MGRELSENLAEILATAYARKDTLELYLNDGSIKRLSRGAVTRNGSIYLNYIRSVGDMESSIERSVDRINIRCQNVNSILGFDLASSLRLLDYALADYGKIYQSTRNIALIDDDPQVFRGVMANAEADEENFNVELIVDYESLGAILASRGLTVRCSAQYKNGIECTSTSLLPSCPKDRQGCKERDKEYEHLGFEFFEEPVSTAPGTGGGGIGGGVDPCFLGHTLIWTPDGEIPISEIQARLNEGKNSIYSFDFNTGEIIVDEIERVWIHETVGYFDFEFDHTIINPTFHHKFLQDFGKWKIADNFARTDTTKAFSQDWFDSTLNRIKWNSDEKVTVFNLKVKKNRTYFANRCAVSNRKREPTEIIPY